MLELDGEALVDSFVVSEGNERLSVPVCALAEALSLAITCTENRAFGFVLDESRPFVVDLEEGYAITGRNVYRINDRAFKQNADIMVDTRELSKWFPLDFSYRKDSSILRMHAREDLPVQGFKKRQRFRNARPPAPARQFDDFTPPRSAFSVPTVDVASRILLSGEDHAPKKTTTEHSLDMSGDLLHMSSETHLLAGDGTLKRLDFTAFRRSDTVFQIGGIPATQLAIGASQAPYVDGVGASNQPMYGLYLSNRPIFGASKFLTHDVNGYLPAGWDAELFHNGVQIAYQPPTPEGMYHFVNLRVYYGSNEFRVILHGPFGERRESSEVFVNDATTPTGELFYTFSAGWPTGLTHSETAGIDRESNITMTSDFGITKALTGSALFVRHTDFYGEEQDYAGVGLRTAVGYTLLSLDLIQSFSPGNGRSAQLVTARSSSRDVFGFKLEAVQRFFHEYESPQFPKTADPLLAKSTVKGSASFNLLDSIRIPYSVEIGVSTKRSGTADPISVTQVSGGWNGWNCNLEAVVSYLQHSVYATGLLQVSTRLKNTSVRGQAGVAVSPSFTPSVIDVSADRDLGCGYLLNTGISHDPAGHVSQLRVGVSKKLGQVGYSISATGATNGAYGVNAGIRASLAADRPHREMVLSAEPLSPYGMIAVSAVVPDMNYPGGRALPGVGFLVNGDPAKTVTGSKGYPVISYLRPDIAVDVTVDLTTVEDPFMVPREDGCHIVPRAGVVSSCTFTMTTGGEIDGMVFARKSKTDEVPLKGVQVDLMTEGPGRSKLQGSVRSEESGYYLFKAVKPGSYRIVIPDAELARLNAQEVKAVAVTMPVGGDMISGKDLFLISAAGKKDAPEGKTH